MTETFYIRLDQAFRRSGMKNNDFERRRVAFLRGVDRVEKGEEQQWLSGALRERPDLRLSMILSCAKALDVSPAWLIGASADPAVVEKSALFGDHKDWQAASEEAKNAFGYSDETLIRVAVVSIPFMPSRLTGAVVAGWARAVEEMIRLESVQSLK